MSVAVQLVEEEFIQHYPNLRPVPDNSHSITRGESVRYEELLKAIAKARLEARKAHGGSGARLSTALEHAFWRALHAYYGRRTYRFAPEKFDQDCARFAESIKDARACIDRTIEQNFNEPDRLRLLMTSDVESEDDPFELFRLCCLRGDDILSQRTRFEARRQLTLAQICFEMRRHGDSPEELARDMAEFDDELKQEYFVKRRSESRFIVADLDPEDSYRVKNLEVRTTPSSGNGHSTESRFVHDPDVRFIRFGGRDIPVYYETRFKRDMVLKLFRKNQRVTQTLTDLLGAKFVFFNEQDLLEGVEHMRRTIVCAPGTVFGEASNISRAGVLDGENGSSAAEFRAWKYNVLLFDRWFELQFMLVHDWINERCSRGPENHALYKLDSNIKKLFPKLFPAPFYLDWNDPTLTARLHRLQLAKIWS